MYLRTCLTVMSASKQAVDWREHPAEYILAHNLKGQVQTSHKSVIAGVCLDGCWLHDVSSSSHVSCRPAAMPSTLGQDTGTMGIGPRICLGSVQKMMPGSQEIVYAFSELPNTVIMRASKQSPVQWWKDQSALIDSLLRST